MSLLESLNGTGGLEDYDEKKHGVPWEKGRKFHYMNKTKKFVLSKYPKVFSNLRVSDIKSAPILIPHSTLMKKIEEFYNEQTQRLLRTKKMGVLDMSKVTREVTQKAMKANPTYFIQSLTNIVYSADKHGEHPEVAQYLKFLVSPTGDDALLYYLYIRQNFKITTHNSFLNNRVSGKDPLKMDMSYTDALEIADHAFYYNPKARKALQDAIKSKVKPKQRIRYYDFMVAAMGADLVYEELEMIHRLVILYRVKGPEEIENDLTLTIDLRKKIKERNQRLGYGGEDEEIGNDDMDLEGGGQRRSVSGLFGDDSGDEGDMEELKRGGNDDIFGEGGDDPLADDDEDEDEDEEEEDEEETSFYLDDPNQLQKYKSKIKLEDNKLQKEIKRMSTRVIQEYITRFLDNNNSAKAGPSKKQQIFDKLYKKIYNLNASIFFTDKNLYLELLRVGKKNKQAAALWEEMNKQYLYMCEFDDVDTELIVQYLNAWLQDELVQTNTDFFLEYEYQVKNPIIEEALKVEAEVTITRRKK